MPDALVDGAAAQGMSGWPWMMVYLRRIERALRS